MHKLYRTTAGGGAISLSYRHFVQKAGGER